MTSRRLSRARFKTVSWASKLSKFMFLVMVVCDLSLNATGQPPQQYWKSALIPNPFKLCKPVLSQTWRQTHVKTKIFQQLLPTKNPRNVVIKEPHHKIQILQPECVAHRFNGHDAFDTSCLSSFMSKAHFDIAWKTTFGPISNDKDNWLKKQSLL